MRTGVIFALVVAQALASARSDRPRARDLGIRPGVFDPGPLDAITDVGDVRVGHVTLVGGDHVRTGVTAILPHGGNLFREKVAGAVFVGNAFGKLAGATQVRELGTIETPIVLTNTLSVGTAVEAVVAWTLAQAGNEDVRSVNAVAGETNDGGLNDIRGFHVTREHVRDAIRSAAGGPVAEGAVGAGTGTQAFGWKGGIGTASRALPARYGGYRLGVLVQSNFGGVLTIDGAPVGKELERYAFRPMAQRPTTGTTENTGILSTSPRDPRVPRGEIPRDPRAPRGEIPRDPRAPRGEEVADGSCMIVVATDAPLGARDLERLAARAIFGLARTGSSYSNGSGDYAIAFSTARSASISGDALSPLFQAALEATEEAVYNSLFRATTVTGNGRTAEAIPIDRVREILKKYGRGQ
jgi:D-aminopeptidase